MKSKKRWFVTALTACLTLSLGICVEALEYDFDGVEDTEYYPSTSYESLYGAKYNYGGSNATDYQWPALPYRTEILTPQIATDKREDWVNKRVKSGLQVLITNPRCVETGLDLNAFTTIIFYSMGYNLFTLRQASRRSWRINQTAPRVEVYMLYYADTMQAKAMKLMASKLAVAGIIEGTFSEEGLAAMSDVKDLTSQMAKELALGIRDNVEDIAAAFRKMAVMNPERKKNIAAAQLKETAAEEQKAPAAKDSFGVRTAQAQVRQALYEGLLARTAEEQKKRKSKKAEVDENQLSIFGFAA